MAAQVIEIPPNTPYDSDSDFCTICFEEGPYVSLPCDCTLKYCISCWDRALAASITTRGSAQCPSCRCAFRVDFDADSASLVFSKETQVTTLSEWRSRLYKNAKPVQIKLLQDFGRGRAQAQGSDCTKPLCVCGSHMQRVDKHSRVIRMLEDTQPGWRTRVTDPDRLVESLAVSSLITCDLCEEVATRTGFVWTCESGPQTVLHPAAYDVCEKCFALHAENKSPHEPSKVSKMEEDGYTVGEEVEKRDSGAWSRGWVTSLDPLEVDGWQWRQVRKLTQACPPSPTHCCSSYAAAFFRAVPWLRTSSRNSDATPARSPRSPMRHLWG